MADHTQYLNIINIYIYINIYKTLLLPGGEGPTAGKALESAEDLRSGVPGQLWGDL